MIFVVGEGDLSTTLEPGAGQVVTPFFATFTGYEGMRIRLEPEPFCAACVRDGRQSGSSGGAPEQKDRADRVIAKGGIVADSPGGAHPSGHHLDVTVTKAQQAADRLAAGDVHNLNGYVLTDALCAPIRPEAYSDRFTDLCQAAGAPRIRLHDVRHSLVLTGRACGAVS